MLRSAEGICDKVSSDLVHSDLDRQPFVPLRKKITLETLTAFEYSAQITQTLP